MSLFAIFRKKEKKVTDEIEKDPAFTSTSNSCSIKISNDFQLPATNPTEHIQPKTSKGHHGYEQDTFGNELNQENRPKISAKVELIK